MECDITSKTVTRHAVIKADPMVYLGQFGKQINEAQLFDISVAEWLRAWDTLTMFEATVCGRS